MTSQLIKFQGTWVAQVRYVIEVIGGIAGAVYEAVPMVKYNGVTYIADKGIQPRFGAKPSVGTVRLAAATGGNTNAGKTFSCTVSSGGTLGTTPVTYQQSGSSLVYTATSPITKTGNDFGLAMNLIKNVAAVAPTVTDDETDGYMVGSSWKDSVTGYTYTCINPTEGAAVWS